MPKKSLLHINKGAISFKYLCIGLFGLGLLALAAASVYFVRTGQPTFSQIPSMSYTSRTPDKGDLLRRINTERKKQNVPELQEDDRLRSVAETRLKEMIAFQRYSHQTVAGKYYYDLLPDVGYETSYSCENLDIEFSPRAQMFIASWMASDQGHKECLLHKDLTRIGIASAVFGKTEQKIGQQTQYLVVTVLAADPQKED